MGTQIFMGKIQLLLHESFGEEWVFGGRNSRSPCQQVTFLPELVYERQLSLLIELVMLTSPVGLCLHFEGYENPKVVFSIVLVSI